MNYKHCLYGISLFLFVTFLGLTAQAQAFVSAKNGVDAGTCPITAPCRSITFALTQAAGGGTVNVIDSGAYEPFVVDKSVTVQAAPGVSAVITRVSPGAGVSVETDSVEYATIRGLTLHVPLTVSGFNPIVGFSLNGSGSVLIDRCILNGFTTGVDAKMHGRLILRDTQVNGATTGINLSPAASILKATIERCAFYRTTTAALNAAARPGAALRLSVLDSQFSGFNIGVKVAPEPGGGASVSLERCMMALNRLGISADGAGADVSVSNSTITENDFGVLAVNGAALRSRLNNTLEHNTNNGNFTSIFAAQ